MVAIPFRGAKKADVIAAFEKAGIPLYEIAEPKEDMIILKKFVFDDWPEGQIEFVFKKLGVWDFSFTAWRLWAWEEKFGAVVGDREIPGEKLEWTL